MRALVVYESMFGNTQAIARAIVDGLSSAVTVDLVEVGAAPTTIPSDVGLLVVGGPTHGHGMSKPETRHSAADKATGGVVSRGIGVREWLGSIRRGSTGAAAVAFDTRIKGPRLLWGSAAQGADKELRRLGFRIAAPPESFLVSGPTGPTSDAVVAGEVERARRWGETLGLELAARSPSPIG